MRKAHEFDTQVSCSQLFCEQRAIDRTGQRGGALRDMRGPAPYTLHGVSNVFTVLAICRWFVSCVNARTVVTTAWPLPALALRLDIARQVVGSLCSSVSSLPSSNCAGVGAEVLLRHC
jgi:hypothetical protein